MHQIGEICWTHATGGANSSPWWRYLWVVLCWVTTPIPILYYSYCTKPTEQEFFVSAQTKIVVKLLTEGSLEPSESRSVKDRSKIERNAFDLWGMAAIGEILSCGGGLSLMSSHLMSTACPAATFAILLSRKCSIASGKSEDQCGPCATASYISVLVQGLPVCVGHPIVVYFLRRDATGWYKASLFGRNSFLYFVRCGWFVGTKNCPQCVVQ